MDRVIIIESESATRLKAQNVLLECGFHLGNIRLISNPAVLRDRGRGNHLALVGLHLHTPEMVEQSTSTLEALDGPRIIGLTHHPLLDETVRDQIRARTADLIPVFAFPSRWETMLRRLVKKFRETFAVAS